MKERSKGKKEARGEKDKRVEGIKKIRNGRSEGKSQIAFPRRLINVTKRKKKEI